MPPKGEGKKKARRPSTPISYFSSFEAEGEGKKKKKKKKIRGHWQFFAERKESGGRGVLLVASPIVAGRERERKKGRKEEWHAL